MGSPRFPRLQVDPVGEQGVLARAAALIAPYKLQSHRWLEAAPGARLLDVGCGGGCDTLQLAQQVGPMGHVLGVDRDGQAIADAVQQTAAAGLAGWTRHLVADACRLPLSSRSFDASRADRVFQHLRDPGAALAEMARVTRAGGRVVLAESDYGSFSLQTDEQELQARLCEHVFQERLVDAFAGRKLRGLLLAQGLHDVQVEVHPLVVTELPLFRRVVDWDRQRQRLLEAGIASPGEFERLEHDLQRSHVEGRFWCAFHIVLARGTLPATGA